MFRSLLRRLVAILCAVPAAGTLLSFSRNTHWIFRVWDFPRAQIAVVAAAAGAIYARFFFRRRPSETALVAASGAVVAYQIYRIHAYTPLVRPTVRRVTRVDPRNRIRLLIANVLTGNRDYPRLLEQIRRNDPDLILAVEVDQAWVDALDTLATGYPHCVRYPLDNTYGMVLYSRLELVEPCVKFLVQDDIPSVHTGVRLRSGQVIQLHGLHPRPPEPIHDEPSSPRDAELVIVGRLIGRTKGAVPTIVAGDLNDVAWSTTSELFVRLSGLLDPRVGRGLYNSFNANNPLFRYPLDHIFHSVHFKLVGLRRLPHVGSDHFPMLVELQYEPDEGPRQQEPSHRRPGDEEKADDKLRQQARDAAMGKDRPRGGHDG